jgi:hypothetical protein
MFGGVWFRIGFDDQIQDRYNMKGRGFDFFKKTPQKNRSKNQNFVFFVFFFNSKRN